MRFQLSFFFMFLIAVVVFANYINDAYACSCAQLTEQEALDLSFASFVGVPTKIESTHVYTNQVTFEIEKPVKNIVQNMTEITLTTPSQGPACGYHFENNTRYLVHTHEMKNQKYLQTSLCSGNKELGFSSIPLIIDESVLANYPVVIYWYPIMLYLTIAGIISGIAIVIWRKRK
ncbi:hypothetical protein K0U27_10580 [archaeon]|nr:hypothetical protein [archaeon]